MTCEIQRSVCRSQTPLETVEQDKAATVTQSCPRGEGAAGHPADTSSTAPPLPMGSCSLPLTPLGLVVTGRQGSRPPIPGHLGRIHCCVLPHGRVQARGSLLTRSPPCFLQHKHFKGLAASDPFASSQSLYEKHNLF